MKRLIAVACTVAIKFASDVFYTNKVYAQIASLSLAEFNTLEKQLFIMLDGRLNVKTEEFRIYKSQLFSHT